MLKKATVISSIVLFISVLFIFESSIAAKGSDVVTSVTTGKRKIISHNIQKAKQGAVSDALGVAVQKAFATLVSSQTFASNLEFFYNRVLSRTSDYIITYRVLGGVENRGAYLVAVESKVDTRLLVKKLTAARIINAKKDKPAVLFFVAEKTPLNPRPEYWWGNTAARYKSFAEKIIIEKMLQDRFVVIGSDVRPDPSFYNITFNAIDDLSAARKLGRKMKADMIVFGTAGASEAINRMGEEKAFNTEIKLDAYNLETGEKAVSSQVQAVAKSKMDQEGIIQSIEKAAVLSARDLSQKMEAYWSKNLRKENVFDVKLEGDDFLPRYIALKQRFRQMAGIENMQPKEVGSNHAVLEMFYKGKSFQFADAIMLKTFDSFGLEILDVTNRLVVIRFIEKE